VYCLSLAGTIADLIIAFSMLIPAAIYEYISTNIFTNKRTAYTKIIAIITAPVGISYTIAAYFSYIVSSLATLLLVKSRISDGRLRISYDKWRDSTEVIGLRSSKQTHTGMSLGADDDDGSLYDRESGTTTTTTTTATTNITTTTTTTTNITTITTTTTTTTITTTITTSTSYYYF